jgi:chromate reductase
MTKVAVLIGSLRREAFSRKLAHALIDLAPSTLSFDIVEIGGLALFNQDFETDGTTPPEYIVFRDRVRAADAVLFVTPEYNRSVPAALKNALDVGSRPYGSSVFLDMPAMQQPEAYIGNVAKLFADDGSVVPASREFLGKIMTAFAAWIDRTAPSIEKSNG